MKCLIASHSKELIQNVLNLFIEVWMENEFGRVWNVIFKCLGLTEDFPQICSESTRQPLTRSAL